MGPAETLRAAAKLLRRRGHEATPGPWRRPLDVRYKAVVTAVKPPGEPGRYLDGRPERVGVVQLNTWSDGAFMRKRGGRDLEWIALASPVIAEPLAEWLEGCAVDLGPQGDAPDFALCDEPGSVQSALTLARALLGEEADR